LLKKQGSIIQLQTLISKIKTIKTFALCPLPFALPLPQTFSATPNYF